MCLIMCICAGAFYPYLAGILCCTTILISYQILNFMYDFQLLLVDQSLNVTHIAMGCWLRAHASGFPYCFTTFGQTGIIQMIDLID